MLYLIILLALIVFASVCIGIGTTKAAAPKRRLTGMAAPDKGKSRLTGAAAGAVTAAGLLAIAVVGNYEGLRLYAYQDVVGVWTACYGSTKGIHKGMRFTKDQCDILFIEDLTRHEAGMRACLRNPDKLSDKTYVSMLSITYNIGVGGFCRSSMARHINAGNLVAACHDLLKYNKAGGRVVSGLVTRRRAEMKLCLEGLRPEAYKAATAAPVAPETAPAAPQPTPAPATKPETVPLPETKPETKPAPAPYSYEWWSEKIHW